MLSLWWQWMHCNPDAGEGRITSSGSSQGQAPGEHVLWPFLVASGGGACPQGTCKYVVALLLGAAELLPVVCTSAPEVAASSGGSCE